ncbi:MAG: InlB B-repeat-containing protein [Sedimentibacter saalensis]|uniref:InlB B-repeat-containing protein n=1 Tax=Sedimentibacter saalensis TaxID=130788 RepID=UPI002B20D14B|nr:InlB B-repeat-containing protein [Sedimentibacter saalensis]MEA5094181.1 InlB B-repeat-containing protein [Sedimentibacter saalensis]
MQSRILKGISFFTLILVMLLFTNISTAFAEDITVGSNTYNENDYIKLKTFLNLNSAVSGKTNGKMINAAYDENNPATWSGVAWTEDAIKRVKSISWSKKYLSGELDISGAESLVLLACDSNSLTALNVSGNTKLTSIRCNTNKLTSIDLSTNIKLDTLYCHTNNLSKLNLSTNTALLYIYCYSNKLTELNVSACSSLNELYCYSNLLTSIDISDNTLLNKLACESNKLTTLDISNNTALTYLACYSNKLSELNVGANTNLLALHCYSNEIADLDLSKNIKLTTLYCNNNPLGELNVSFNTKLTALRCDLNNLTEIDLSKNTELTFLQCDTNKLTTLDVSKNTALTDLRCYSNQLTELNLEKNIVLTKLVCDTNKLTELDVSKNVMLGYLACYSNQLSSLNLSSNTSLVYLYCQENQLSQLDVSANTSIKELYCYGNQLTALDVSANVELAYLRCFSNQLSELEVDKNIALTQLSCQSNQLTELNVSKNKLLTSLDCSSNQLAELDVVNNTGLTTIHCQFNNLIGLDVSSNELLTELWCYSNKLTSLNISENTNLKTVWCYSNKLTTLDLSKSKGLDYLKCNDNCLEEINANVSNKSINISANGNGYVELLRNSVFQFYVVAVPQTGSLFYSWTQAGANVSENLSYNLVAGTSYELKAIFSQNIEFDSQGGSAIADQIVDYGNLITKPAEPILAGYDFKGWYKEAECINAWDFAADTVTQNIILYAKWTESILLPTVYTVTFNVNGGSAVANITDIVSGSVITEPDAPTKADSDFKGWYKEAELINKWDFSTNVVIGDITLYAKWTAKAPVTYTVTFNTTGGSAVPSITGITSGSAITAPTEPIKAGCDFKDWYKEAELINAWNFDTEVVIGDITLYAKWTAKAQVTYTVTFNTNGGSAVPSVTGITSGSAITVPREPIKAGCDFKGWYKEAELINTWNFDTEVVIGDITLYAKWTAKAPVTYTVTFNTNGGSAVTSVTGITSGSAITVPTEPTKAEYDFVGWYKDSALTAVWNFKTDIVTEDISLYAKWAKQSNSDITNNVNPSNNPIPIIINGETEYVAIIEINNAAGNSITRIQIDGDKLYKKIMLESMYPKITIPISGDSEIKITELNGQTVKLLEDRRATIEIAAGDITYTLPADQINIDKVAEKMGATADMKNITIAIRISNASMEMEYLLNAAAEKDNFKVVTKPVEFSIVCSNNEQTVEVSRFNTYVRRTIAIPNNVNNIVTGIVLNIDGTFSPVPTSISKIDGKYYANINSLTNSVYTVVWSQKSFIDVEDHWSKAAVNDMGSRLVIHEVGDEIFQPDRDITRAEFTKIVVNGLGLAKFETTKSFYDDVNESAWYFNPVVIASEYGLVSGNGNGKFAPNEKITREQAMNVIAKAMKITGLSIELTPEETKDILKSYNDSNQASDWAKESIAACIKAGIVSGRDGYMIAPDSNITRAEAVMIIRNLLEKSNLI